MSTIALEGNILNRKDRFAKTRFGHNPSPAIEITSPPGNLSSLSAQQAKSLKLLTFGGSNFHQGSHIELEARFIHELKTAKDPDEKAGAAELLGRAHSINAVPALVALLDAKEDIRVRIASAAALGEIGDSTHPDSFTRSTLSQELIRHYQESKQTLAQSLGRKVGSSVAERRKQALEDESRMRELQVILQAVGRLNAASSTGFLKQEYDEANKASENHLNLAEKIMNAIQSAEEALVKELELVYEKPIKKVREELAQGEYEALKAQQKMTLPNGDEVTVGQAMMALRRLHTANRFANELLGHVVTGLSQKETPELNTFLRKGLTATQPAIKEQTLAILGERGQLHFSTEIQPNLSHRSPAVRKTSIQSLFTSSEKASKQKLVELLNPGTFFQTLRVPLNEETLGEYVSFLTRFAQSGDKYINMLARTARQQDFDLASRKMAALVMSLMAQPPANKSVSPETLALASNTLQQLSLEPNAETREEKDALSLYATRLWLGVKDPQAVSKAMKLVECRLQKLSVEQQEDLLIAIHRALQNESEFGNHDNSINNKAENQVKLAAIQALKEARVPGISEETLKELEAKNKPDLKQTILDPEMSIVKQNKYIREKADADFVKRVRTNLDQMRPVLLEMLDHPASPTARTVAARILGTLKDDNDDTINKLLEKTRSPLKGIIDWDEDPSYRGDPSRYGATIRVNNINALGRIGTAKALDVMLDALNDPVLRSYVLKPLGDIAPAVNKGGNAEQLKRVKDALVPLLANADTSRTARAMRISTASALYQFDGGVEAIKEFIKTTPNPNFKRHALAGLVMNNYALDPKHPDHALVRPMLMPELGVEELHKKGITGKGVDIAVVDGGYVDQTNTEAFQNRVKLPAKALDPEHYHPTMVASTAAGNGKIVGVAPDSMIYSDKWPDLGGKDPMEGYKKLIAGKLRGENNIRVINNSWGLTNNAALIYKDIRDMLREFKKVVQQAEKAGVQIVFSAGNEGEGLGFPSVGTLSLFGLDIDKLTQEEKADLNYILEKVLLVGASNTQGLDKREDHKIAEFSSLGDSLNRKLIPTVLAPGVDMMVYSYDQGLKPKELVNGTSFSGPFVAGLIALMFQANPRLKPDQIREVLTKTAVKLPNLPDTYQGYGEVDPKAAIEMASAYGKKEASAQS